MRQKLLRIRTVSQVFFLAFFIYILWSTTYPLSGSISPEFFFQIDPLVMGTTALSERIVLPGLIGAGGMVVLGLLLGRFFCGWVCPLGTVIDAVGTRRSRHGTRDENRRVQQQRTVKFFLLAGMVLFSLAGIQIAWVLDPVVLFARFVSLNFIPTLTRLVDTGLTVLIRGLGLYGAVYDFYHVLRGTVLGVKTAYFSHAAVIFAGFLTVLGTTYFASRWWCRVVCPLGAFYGLIGRIALLRRTVQPCVLCGHCLPACPTGAIRADMSYDPAECIVCLACVYTCPSHRTRFSLCGWFFRRGEGPPRPTASSRSGISRRSLLALLAGSLGASLIARGRRALGVEANTILIRPPGALEEKEFLNRCIRCGNCMKVCPTNGLQPLFLYPSVDALWTPQLVADIGYCEYHCTQCGAVCPTGAIPRLEWERKHTLKLGIAKIDRRRCLPYAEKKSCIVCEEHCPIPRKAIQLTQEIVDGRVLLVPVVNETLCIGCGICQTKCPVRPVRAIKIFAYASDRTAV